MKLKIFIIIIGLAILFSCAIEVEDEVLTIEDWTEKTHSNNAEPDYAIVFPQKEVLRFDININSEDWETIVYDMEENYGSFGRSGGMSGPPGASSNTDNPVFVPCSFNFNGKEWYKVGIRFKGNSSLKACWQNGILKMPLKLDFDQFEDDYPDILNQRFYGFRQLSLSNNYDDTSFIREKIVADLFREAGVPAPQTTFCRVYVDYGNGPVYFGLYALVEVVDDTMLSNQFGSNDGNCYKPDGIGASFGNGLFDETVFEKKTNEETGDWSDIISIFEILHSEIRTTNPEEWRAQLDQVFNTEHFLNWLAVNTTIQNWDTYGRMTHNYYLYNNPENSKMTWIPWDNNEAMNVGKQGGALSISMDEVRSNWPLIRYLLDDPVYKSIYIEKLKTFSENIFNPDNMLPRYEELHSLIAPYVSGEYGEINGYTFQRTSSDFENAHDYLIDHIYDRQSVVNYYIK